MGYMGCIDYFVTSLFVFYMNKVLKYVFLLHFDCIFTIHKSHFVSNSTVSSELGISEGVKKQPVKYSMRLKHVYVPPVQGGRVLNAKPMQ